MTNNISISSKKIAFVVNGQSQRGRKLFEHAKDLFERNDIKLSESVCVAKYSQLKKTILNLIAQDIDMIIIGGGDGTISEIVDYGVKKNILFAVLPLGTSNSFARSLNMPLDLDSAIKVIKNGKVKQIDLGKIDDDYFANTANIGLSVEVNMSVNNNFKRNFGRLAYLPVAIWNLFNFKPFEVTISSNNEINKYKCIEMLIANGQFQGGIPLALNADLDSGRLIVKFFICKDWKDKFNLLGYWFLSLLNHNIKNRRIKQFGLEKATIKTDREMYIDIDGEANTKTPFVLSVAERALSIIVN